MGWACRSEASRWTTTRTARPTPSKAPTIWAPSRIPPFGLSFGALTISVRGLERSDDGTQLIGSWTPLAFTYQAPVGPAIATLTLVSDTGASPTDGVTTDPSLKGTLEGNDFLPFTRLEIDVTGDLRADDYASTDQDGAFEFTPALAERLGYKEGKRPRGSGIGGSG